MKRFVIGVLVGVLLTAGGSALAQLGGFGRGLEPSNQEKLDKLYTDSLINDLRRLNENRPLIGDPCP